MHLALLHLVVLSLAVAPTPHGPKPFIPRPLSPFEREKAVRLITTRYACLGCHELNGSGGRIGPRLTTVGTRRSAAYVYAMITDPQETVPGTVMPRPPLPEGAGELLANYLMELAPKPAGVVASIPRVLPLENPGVAGTLNGAALYRHYCAACHGPEGMGNGNNARALPKRPAVLASSAAMSARSDDALFDTIHGGGFIMNRSNLMPAFGMTLSRAQIRALVTHIRRLCRCQGPAWSRE